jgi:hypothetical protein
MFGRLKSWWNAPQMAKSFRSEFLNYQHQVRAAVRDCYPKLERPEVLEIEHLIDHNENGEALLTLARIIVEKKATVSCGTITTLKKLIDGFAEASLLPENLHQCAAKSERVRTPAVRQQQARRIHELINYVSRQLFLGEDRAKLLKLGTRRGGSHSLTTS